MTAGRLRGAFVATASTWAALLVLVPFLASRAHASIAASALIVGVYALGGFICHQLPERSFHPWTAQMPVCARCAGIYFGAMVGAAASLVRTAKGVRHITPDVVHGASVAAGTVEVVQGFGAARRAARTAQPAAYVRIALALAVTPSLATLLYEWTTATMPSHAIRAAAGVPIGVVVAWLIVAAADNDFK